MTICIDLKLLLSGLIFIGSFALLIWGAFRRASQ